MIMITFTIISYFNFVYQSYTVIHHLFEGFMISSDTPKYNEDQEGLIINSTHSKVSRLAETLLYTKMKPYFTQQGSRSPKFISTSSKALVISSQTHGESCA